MESFIAILSTGSHRFGAWRESAEGSDPVFYATETRQAAKYLARALNNGEEACKGSKAFGTACLKCCKCRFGV